MSALGPEALLAAAYAGILLLSAVGLDVLARNSGSRAERYRTGGFRFLPDLDAWLCPEGEYLHRHETDHERRLVRYRARPHVCNACPAKPGCTDSDGGREIVCSLEAWARSEAGRFHRGISLALVALAGLIAIVALVRNHELAELVLLGGVLTLTGFVAWRLVAELRAEPVPGLSA